MEKVLIFGHQRPDTDSITASIALSYLKNKQGMDTIPVVLGSLNNETKFVLEYFNVEIPKYINDVKSKIKDLKYTKDYYVNEKESIYQAFQKMLKASINKIPIVNDEQELVGILSMKDISKNQLSNNLYSLHTSYQHILEVLEGQKIVKYEEEINGELLIASYKSTTIIENNQLTPDKILIVGNRHSVIEHAIKEKIKLLILTGNAEIKKEHLELAKQNRVNIIQTKFDTFKVARTINLCNYVKELIGVKDVLCVNESDDVKEFIEIANKTKYSYFPVLNNDNKCLGIVRYADTTEVQKRNVILVDHNAYDQSALGLEEANILEVIDHHNIGNIGTSTPINFRNMPVGSTNTIIYHIYKENNIEIEKNIAGLMLSGILSDTLLLKSPTTTDIDRTVVEELCKIVNLDYYEYGLKMLKAGSSLKGKSIEDILYTDFKDYPLAESKMGLGQISTTNAEEILEEKEKYIELLDKIAEENHYQLVALFITDIIENGSYVLYNQNAKDLIKKAYNLDVIEEGIYLPNVVSRKKQMVPNIMRSYEN